MCLPTWKTALKVNQQYQKYRKGHRLLMLFSFSPATFHWVIAPYVTKWLSFDFQQTTNWSRTSILILMSRLFESKVSASGTTSGLIRLSHHSVTWLVRFHPHSLSHELVDCCGWDEPTPAEHEVMWLRSVFRIDSTIFQRECTICFYVVVVVF